MQVPIEDIKVTKRIRQDMGEIEVLADSMKRLGQISPIVISKNNTLIAGGRRLEAAHLLNWHTINAVIAEEEDEARRLEMEIEENTHRQDLSPEELADAAGKLHRLKNPGFFRRILKRIAGFFKRLFGNG